MAHARKIAVIGLGYVGLPVAVALGGQQRVIGFDISTRRIEELRTGFDRTGEVGADKLADTDVLYTSDPKQLSWADFHIVAVPTPIDASNQPDLRPLIEASQTVGGVLKSGDIVIYESTVYPGATEEECIPILERVSGLRAGSDFTVGYSPERINPGDTDHTFSTITKVVSGQDEATLGIVARVYGSVVSAGVHRASSIRVAEAAKVIENTQRDLNIALMNELALIFDRLGIDTRDVLAAASTKWNFLPFTPGLVGGHCIGVDPFYLTYKAIRTGYHPQVILAGRRINDEMGTFLAGQAVKQLIRQGQNVRESVVTVLGLTFKEDVADLRNTRVIDVVRELQDYGIEVQVHDPLIKSDEASEEFGIALHGVAALRPAHCIILAVPHKTYVEQGWALIEDLLHKQGRVVMDVKGVLPRESAPKGILLWRL